MIAQTVGSLVCRIGGNDMEIFATGTSAPCLGLFRPVTLDALPAGYIPASGKADSQSLWWKQERFHRRALEDLPYVWAMVREDQNRFEQDMLAGRLSDPWHDADRVLDEWTIRLENHLQQTAPEDRAKTDRAFQHHWNALNQAADFTP